MLRAAPTPFLISLLIFVSGCGFGDEATPTSPNATTSPSGAASSSAIAPAWPGLTLATWRPPAAEESLRILIGGHLYGRPGVDAPRPARVFREGLDHLRKRRPHLVVSLGDLLYTADEDQLARTRPSLERFGVPVLNAVGNHDLAPDPAFWRKRIGHTWFRIDHGAFCGLVLDTESDVGQLGPAQLDFALDAIRNLPESCRVLALFLHKPIFADRPATAPLALAGNSPPTQLLLVRKFPKGPPFSTDLRPALTEAARTRRVLLFCGDIGAHEERWGLFHHREPDTGLELIGTGIGDTPRDSLLELVVSPRGEAELRIVPLGPEAPRGFAERNAEAWRTRFFPDGLPAGTEAYLSRSR